MLSMTDPYNPLAEDLMENIQYHRSASSDS